MIIIVILALVVLLYFFGLKALYCSAGLFAVFYLWAVIAARRSSAGGERGNLASKRAECQGAQSEPACCSGDGNG